MGTQISIFDGANKYVNDKPIRLIECFAGYGSQALALKYLGIPFEHHRIAEWAVKSIQAYKDMHFPNDNTDYSCGMSFDNVIDYLFERGISADYNKPMTREQIKRMGENKCRTVYNNIKATHNLVSVCNVKAKDLEITDTDRFTYLLTYSFPCQDLSSAGLSKGMAKGSGTRSGLLWEVERLLKEMDELPQILLMENVPEVIGQKNKDSFGDWIAFLDSMGYKSKWEILNGTDFEIPQNRKRCFMVSVLGDYYYDFPQKLGCTLRLKDLLEKNVSEEYYLSDNILNYFIRHTKESEEKGNGFRFEPTDGDCIAKCVTTRAGGRMDDNFIDDKVHSVVKLPHGYFEGSIERNAGTAPTIDTGVGNWHTLIGEEYKVYDGKNKKEIDSNCAGTILTNSNFTGNGVFWVQNQRDFRIRKLTPRECFRLMGVKDEDYERVERNQSKSSLYHLAGDSIVVNVLMAIFKELFM